MSENLTDDEIKNKVKSIKNQMLFLRIKIVGLFFGSFFIALALYEGARATGGVNSVILYGLEMAAGICWIMSIFAFIGSFEFGRDAIDELPLLSQRPDQYNEKYKNLSSLIYYIKNR